jgi:Sulfotransferase family
MKNPYVFMIGCQRSGTTLLQHMVNSHPQIAVMPEGGWFGTWYEQGTGLTSRGFATRELVPLVLRTHENVDLGATPEQLYAMVEPEGAVPYADFVAFLFNRCGKSRGKALVGSKNPDYLRHLPTLHRLWPRAKFVHIVRDGRDVCLSASARWEGKPDFRGFPFLLDEKPDRIFDRWTGDPVTTTALWWEWTVRLGRDFGAMQPPHLYYEMRYEGLVTDPETECRQLCNFLGIPFDEAMLRHHETFTPRRGGDGAILHASVGLPVTAGLRDWRRQMDPAELERFEAAAGSLLDELEYERAFAHPKPGSVQEAARLRSLLHGLAAAPAPLAHKSAESRQYAAD